MAGIIYACITPHGSEVIPELAAVGAEGGGTAVGAPAAMNGPGDLSGVLAQFGELTRAMEEVGRRLRRADPDTIIIATPHNLRLDGGYTAVVTAELSAGSLAAEVPSAYPGAPGRGGGAGGGEGGGDAGEGEAGGQGAARPGAVVEASFPCDRDLARDIVTRARQAAIPVVGVNYATLGGSNSRIPMDWGALIPLYFMGDRRTQAGAGPGGGPRVVVGPWRPGEGEGSSDPRLGEDQAGARPKVVLIGPSRDVPRETLVRLGEVVAEAAEASGRKVAFVASCDHGHAHLEGGPYGFDPASAAYDKLVTDIVRTDRLGDILGIDPDLVEAGKPDSLWQMLILLGALRWQEKAGRPFTGQFLTYQVPTYFGMLVASYEPGRS